MFRFVCDLETTGLDPIRNDIIEICILAIDENLKVVGEFHRRVKPFMGTWESEAQEFHGITPEQASNFMPRRSFCIELLHFLLPFKDKDNWPREFICHALPEKFFDRKNSRTSWPHIDYHFLEWAFRKEGLETSFWKVFSSDKIVSTIKLARIFSGEHRGHGLKKWCKIIDFTLEHHQAKSDTYACLELYKYFTERECITLETTKKKESISLEKGFKLRIEGLYSGV